MAVEKSRISVNISPLCSNLQRGTHPMKWVRLAVITVYYKHFSAFIMTGVSMDLASSWQLWTWLLVETSVPNAWNDGPCLSGFQSGRDVVQTPRSFPGCQILVTVLSFKSVYPRNLTRKDMATSLASASNTWGTLHGFYRICLPLGPEVSCLGP